MRIIWYLALIIGLLWLIVPYEDTLAYKLTKKLEERQQHINEIMRETHGR